MTTERQCQGGGVTTLVGGTAISGGGTPETGSGTPFRPVPAEFNHCFSTLMLLAGIQPVKTCFSSSQRFCFGDPDYLC